jgi:hypothetical protein
VISFEDVKKYLPHHLNEEDQGKLFNDLKQFPCNIDKRFYSSKLSDEVKLYQGDGTKSLIVVNLPDPKIAAHNCLILSNTCDISSENIRFFPPRLVYAPIFSLEKYKHALMSEHAASGDSASQDKIFAHIDTIKKQFISNIFYLPACDQLAEDSIVFLDRLNNCSTQEITTEFISENKLFTLSNYGFYIFLIKLSIHFTRIREGIDRNTGNFESAA